MTPAVAILDPVQIDHAERGGGDARGPVIVVFIDVQVKGGITVYVVCPKTRSQSLLNGLISQPLFQFSRSTNIVNDALFAEKKNVE